MRDEQCSNSHYCKTEEEIPFLKPQKRDCNQHGDAEHVQESEHNCIVGVQENPVGNPCHKSNQHGDTKQQKRAVYQSHIVLAVGFSRPLHSLMPENHRDSCENHENCRAEYIAVVVLQKRFRLDDYVKHH